MGWATDLDGVLYGVGRNEDGDDSGWGSRVLKFDPRTMPKPEWMGNASNPEIFESPRMFRHEQDLYLIARTDPNGPFMSDNPLNLPPTLHHLYDLASYREERRRRRTERMLSFLILRFIFDSSFYLGKSC